jgi:hypothetical protein
MAPLVEKCSAMPRERVVAGRVWKEALGDRHGDHGTENSLNGVAHHEEGFLELSVGCEFKHCKHTLPCKSYKEKKKH